MANDISNSATSSWKSVVESTKEIGGTDPKENTKKTLGLEQAADDFERHFSEAIHSMPAGDKADPQTRGTLKQNALTAVKELASSLKSDGKSRIAQEDWLTKANDLGNRVLKQLQEKLE